MKNIAILLSGLILTTAIAGCHTVKGAGQDIQQGGQAISNAADDARK